MKYAWFGRNCVGKIGRLRLYNVVYLNIGKEFPRRLLEMLRDIQAGDFPFSIGR